MRRSLAIAAAAVVAGLAVFVLVATGDRVSGRGTWAIFGPLVGWSFVGTGIYAWLRRPESRFGALMTLLGFTWFFTPLATADNPVAFALGLLLGALWGPVLAHVLLSFPTGRLQTRGQRRLVLAAYVLVPLAPVPAFLVSASEDFTDCQGECPRNLLLPEERRYVDASGAPVDLPGDDDPTRAITEVEHDGRRVAAIVHDRGLVEDAATGLARTGRM
jgi:hypothetical protein